LSYLETAKRVIFSHYQKNIQQTSCCRSPLQNKNFSELFLTKLHCRVDAERKEVFFHRRKVVNCCRLDVELRVGSKLRFLRQPTGPDCRTGPPKAGQPNEADPKSTKSDAANKHEALRVFVDTRSDLGKVMSRLW
jgi:hypothetical protein